MNNTQFRYFTDDDVEVFHMTSLRNEKCAQLFPGRRAKRNDSFSRLVGWPENVKPFRDEDTLPIARIVCVKLNGKNHKCDARCRSAKGPNCECECRGQFHGSNLFN